MEAWRTVARARSFGRCSRSEPRRTHQSTPSPKKKKPGYDPGFFVRSGGKKRSVHRVLETLAGGEFRRLAGRNLHRSAGLRVAPGGRFPLHHREIAEADQADVAA